jgi:hypothetical protein
MKKEIIVSNTIHPNFLTYIPSENCWKCTYKAFYNKPPNISENWSREINVYFLKNEKVVINEEKSGTDEIEIFHQMKALDSYKDHFENCWDVIEDVRIVRHFTPNEFDNFYYNFNEKYGRFEFEELLVDYLFLFEPRKGMSRISVSYSGFNGYSEKVRLSQPPNILFGDQATNMLNEMIKKKLKLRYLF